MNRAIIRLDESTVNYIVGQFIFDNMPESITNDNKFRMEVMRYKNKDIRIVVKTGDTGVINTLIHNIEVEANNH